MDDVNMTIGERTAKAIDQRVKYGNVAPELRRLGISHTSFSKWKHNNVNPQAYWLQQLALDGYDTYWILTGKRQYPEADTDFELAGLEEEE